MVRAHNLYCLNIINVDLYRELNDCLDRTRLGGS